MGQALGCCRAPGGAQSGEQIKAQVDPASGSAANGAPVASGAVPSAAAAAPAAGSPRFARRTSLSGYHSATGYSSDGDDEWHDALSDIGSGGCRARCCLCRTADEHLRMRPSCKCKRKLLPLVCRCCCSYHRSCLLCLATCCRWFGGSAGGVGAGAAFP